MIEKENENKQLQVIQCGSGTSLRRYIKVLAIVS